MLLQAKKAAAEAKAKEEKIRKELEEEEKKRQDEIKKRKVSYVYIKVQERKQAYRSDLKCVPILYKCYHLHTNTKLRL